MATGASSIINTWKPYLNKAVSDFDTTSLMTADWVYQLPFGKGKPYLGTANAVCSSLDRRLAVFGHLPLHHWPAVSRSSSPAGRRTGSRKATALSQTPARSRHKHFDSSGNVLYFANANAINSGVYNGSPVRLPYPGETGERNKFRGDGYLDLDSGLTKTWGLGRYGNLVFAWEVYNVTNSNRFDPFSIGSGLTGGNLGVASSRCSPAPRRMQFSLRYDF